jgi:hypothetical protein
MPRKPRYSEAEARAAIASSRSFTEALRRLGMRPAGGNHATLRRYAAEVWRISTDHFDRYAAGRDQTRRRSIPLEDVLVEGSTYDRGMLKKRLYGAGIKQPRCEMCDQGEVWRGARMALILDHINGVASDNRLENLRIVCPNCAATLDTHCGKLTRRTLPDRICDGCGEHFSPNRPAPRFCSQECWARNKGRAPQPDRRRVRRPPYEQLVAEIDECGYLATGRRYGVSDNAVRKWMRQYERERAIAEGRDPKVIEIPRRTWPNRRRKEAA